MYQFAVRHHLQSNIIYSPTSDTSQDVPDVPYPTPLAVNGWELFMLRDYFSVSFPLPPPPLPPPHLFLHPRSICSSSFWFRRHRRWIEAQFPSSFRQDSATSFPRKINFDSQIVSSPQDVSASTAVWDNSSINTFTILRPGFQKYLNNN